MAQVCHDGPMTTGDASGLAIAGEIASGAADGYQVGAEAREAAKGGVSAGEAIGIASAAAGLGAAVSGPFAPIGAALGALAAILGVGLSSLLGGLEPKRVAVPVFDRLTWRRHEGKIVAGKPVSTWELGRNAFERSLSGAPAGPADLGTVLWLLRRTREDGGGAGEIATIARRIGIPYDPPADLAGLTREKARQLGGDVFALWKSLPFVPSSAKKPPPDADLVYMGARLAGLSVPDAQAFATGSENPVSRWYLDDLRATIDRELPERPLGVSSLAKVPPSVARKVASMATAGELRVRPSAIRRLRVGALRSAVVGPSSAQLVGVALAGGALLGAWRMGWLR